MLEQSLEILTAEIRKLTAAVTEQNRLLGQLGRTEGRTVSPPVAWPQPPPPAVPLAETKPEQASLLDERQVASALSLSVASVRRWRLLRQGPPYVKIGSAVRYERRELLEWVARQRRSG